MFGGGEFIVFVFMDYFIYVSIVFIRLGFNDVWIFMSYINSNNLDFIGFDYFNISEYGIEDFSFRRRFLRIFVGFEGRFIGVY